MDIVAAIKSALSAVDENRRELRRLGKNRPEGWVHEYARRRELVTSQIGELVRLTQRLVGQDERPETLRVLEQAKTYDTELRNHQSRWPMILIQRSGEDFLASISKLDAMHEDLRTAIASL